MKIAVISDTHNRLKEIIDTGMIPDADILIHAGDLTGRGTIQEISHFNSQLGRLPHKHKIVIAGNHDWLFQTNPFLARSIITNAIYLEDSSVVVGGLKFYGSPWQPTFYDWAFNLNRGLPILEKWKMIPSDTDVLITHGPPKGILDNVIDDSRITSAGCAELRKEVFGRIKPSVHIFGHIHSSPGVYIEKETTFINATILDDSYKIQNKPIFFTINT